MLLPSSESE